MIDLQVTLERLRAAFSARLKVRVGALRDAVDLARQSADARHVAEVERLAHALIGAASSYEMRELAEAATALRQAAETVSKGAGVNALAEPMRQIVDAAAREASDPDVPVVATEPGGPSTRGRVGRRLITVGLNPEDTRVLVDVARARAYGLRDCATVQDALAALNEDLADVLLVQLRGGMIAAGISAASALRRVAGMRAVPLIFVGEDIGLVDRAKAARAGGEVFLCGPLSSGEVSDALRLLTTPHVEGAAETVLIVDDDQAFCASMAAQLSSNHVRVSTLSEPLELLTELDAIAPDVLLIDLHIPEVDGLDLCRVIRREPRWRDLPIGILSADTSAAARARAFQAGADDFIAKPIGRAELYARLSSRIARTRSVRARASRDNLTGLLNRAAFEDAFEARLADAVRRNKPLSFALLDLDEFKKVNDTYGHGAGDTVLARVGALLNSRFRTEDLRGRWGGEEFCVAFSGEDRSTSTMVMRRALDELRATPVRIADGAVAVSFSAGIATFPDDGVTLEELTRSADARMYQAKRTGRAQVVG